MKTANKKKALLLTRERKLEPDMIRFRCSCYYNELKEATRFKDSCSNLICKLWKKRQYSVLPHRQIKYPVDFDDELKIGDVRYDKMT